MAASGFVDPTQGFSARAMGKARAFRSGEGVHSANVIWCSYHFIPRQLDPNPSGGLHQVLLQKF